MALLGQNNTTKTVVVASLPATFSSKDNVFDIPVVSETEKLTAEGKQKIEIKQNLLPKLLELRSDTVQDSSDDTTNVAVPPFSSCGSVQSQQQSFFIKQKEHSHDSEIVKLPSFEVTASSVVCSREAQNLEKETSIRNAAIVDKNDKTESVREDMEVEEFPQPSLSQENIYNNHDGNSILVVSPDMTLPISLKHRVSVDDINSENFETIAAVESTQIEEDGDLVPTTGLSHLLNDQQEILFSKYPELFVCSTAIEAHEIIQNYAEETVSTFVSMRKMKQFGVTEGGIDMSRKNYRVFYESADVKFDGIPYVYVADKMYICHLGKDKTEVTRQKIRLQSMEKRLQMGLPLKDVPATRLRTKKIDCPVKITVKMIAKFPQFKVTRKTKRVCETSSKKVRQALIDTNGNVSCYYSFVGRLPGLDEHNHSLGEANASREPIDPLIKDLIIQLTWEGSAGPKEIKARLDSYVEKQLFHGKELPSKNRRRYYPTSKDIRNYMNKAKMLTRFSSEIREELQSLALKLPQARPTETFLLQSDNVEADDPMHLLKEKAVTKPTLIFCHQTSQQQRLMKRYGNQVIVCEITSSVQCIPFPLFCLFVQTNVDYQLVSTFIVEKRNHASILQGFTAIKEWNPTWMPKHVTIDYSEEQKSAAVEAFPGSNVFIADHSRRQYWKDWLQKVEHSFKSRNDTNEIFRLFETIANAYNEEILHEAALQLENADVWRSSATLRNWFNSEWLLEAKKWIVGYRPEDYYVSSHNSAIEQDIKCLRESHISLIRGKKLGSFIEKLVEKIIPDFYRRYVDLNRKSYTQANELKVLYSDQLPTCLMDKPASIIVHILEQMKATEATIFQVSHIQPGLFLVQETDKGDQDNFTVSFGDANNLPSCSCEKWQQFKLPCIHFCSVFRSFPDWGWDMLSASYISNPLISLDYSCIKSWVDFQNIINHGTPPVKLNDYPIEMEKRVTSKETLLDNNAITTPLVNTQNSDTSLAMSPVEQRVEIALQCEGLLKNITSVSNSSLNKHHFSKLKSDLEESIGLLKKGINRSPSLKTDHSLDNDTNQESIEMSSADNSYIIDDEERTVYQVPESDSTEISNETVEVITQEKLNEPPNELLNQSSINVISQLPLTSDLEEETAEQRERKLLALLTASMS